MSFVDPVDGVTLAWIDYETASACDLKKHGSYVYAEDPSTKVLCAAIKVNGHNFFWTMDKFNIGMPTNVIYACGRDFLYQLFSDNVRMIAHNVDFERPISVITLGLPEPRGGWRDTMDLTLMRGLPAGADAAGQYLLGMGKDVEGFALMMKTCKPVKKTGLMPVVTDDVMRRYVLYNFRDVEIQYGITERFGVSISPAWEQRVSNLHRDVNHRGVQVDIKFATTLKSFDDVFKNEARRQVEIDTKGAVKGVDLTRNAFLREYLATQGLEMSNMRADTIAEILEADEDGEIELSTEIYSVLTNRMIVSRASLAKVDAALRRACADGRVRALLRYWGARTGRWCLAKGTLILVHRRNQTQWVPIERVSLGDMVWDGAKWVSHNGLAQKGRKRVQSVGSLTATRDHVLYLNDQDTCTLQEAQDSQAPLWRGVCLPADFPGWPAVRRADGVLAPRAAQSASVEREEAVAPAYCSGISEVSSQGSFRGDSASVLLSRRGRGAGSAGDRRTKDHHSSGVQFDPRGRVGYEGCGQALAPEAAEASRAGHYLSDGAERGGQGVAQVSGPLGGGSSAGQQEVVLGEPREGSGDFYRQCPQGHGADAGDASGWMAASEADHLRRGASAPRGEDHLRRGASAPRGDEQKGLGRAPGTTHHDVQAQQGSDQDALGVNDPRAAGASGETDIGGSHREQSSPFHEGQGPAPRAARRGAKAYRSRAPQASAESRVESLLDPRASSRLRRQAPRAVPVFDILDAGDRNRFLTSAGIVSNCGAGVQIQNMKRPDEDFDLEAAIAAVERNDVETFKILCKDRRPYELLGSLVRGILIPRPGCKFVVGDFSQIEARVLLWMAEDWENLKEHIDYDEGRGPDIYCRFASFLYKKEVTKKTFPKERGIGKIGELACLAEGTLVLTLAGWKSIENVTTSDRVWDGVTWVMHEGLVDRGERPCRALNGIWMTDDHEVFIEDEVTYSPRQMRSYAAGTLHESFLGNTAAALVAHKAFVRSGAEDLRGLMLSITKETLTKQTYDLKNAGPRHRFLVGTEAYGGSKLLVHNCGYQGGVGAVDRFAYAGGVDLAAAGIAAKTIVDAWRAKHPRVVDLWHFCDDAFRRAIRTHDRSFKAARCEFQGYPNRVEIKLPSGRILTYMNARLEPSKKAGWEESTVIAYDSAVKGRVKREEIYGGKIVENIDQAIARDLLADAMLRVAETGDDIVMHVHDEVVAEVPDEYAEEARDSMEAIMKVVPEWAVGLPVNAKPEIFTRYGK